MTGGARIGWLNYSFPFCTLYADRQFLKLACLGNKYVFPREQIIRLSRYQFFVLEGLQIEHRDTSLPEFVVFGASMFFWTSGFRRLKMGLEQLGYDIMM